MKESISKHGHLLFSLTIVYSSIVTPLEMIIPQFRSTSSWIPWVGILLSLPFIYNLWKEIQNLKIENKENLYIIKERPPFYHFISAIPFEVLYFLPSLFPGFWGYLNILKLFRLFLLKKAYNEMSFQSLHLRHFRLPLIFMGLFIAIHLITCSWFVINPENHLTNIDRYIRAFYWTITTLTTTGYGDMTPQTNVARIFSTIVMVTGFSSFSFIAANIASMILSKNRHREATKEKMEDLALFMRYYKVPHKIQGDVFGFYRHKLNKRLSDNDSLIVADLPLALQNELFIYMRIKLLGDIPVFRDLSIKCLMSISNHLEQVSFTSKENILNIGDVADEMFIIDHGEVHIINEQNKVIATLRNGQCFGEMAILLKSKRTAKVIATSYCDCYKLTRENLIKLFENFPELEKNFQSVMTRRISKNIAA